MGYTREVDKKLAEIATKVTVEDGAHELAIYQYANGPKKVRYTIHKSNKWFVVVKLDWDQFNWLVQHVGQIAQALRP